LPRRIPTRNNEREKDNSNDESELRTFLTNDLMCESWNKDGELHHVCGPATPAITIHRENVEYKEWWLASRLHRENGPAIEWGDKIKEWWVNGKRHCLDGPAIVNKYLDPAPQASNPNPYPEYSNSGRIRLLKFYEEICNVSKWLDSNFYGGGGFFNSHGDFGARPKLILSAFGLNHKLINELGNEISVQIVNDKKAHKLDKYFGDDIDEKDALKVNLLDLLGEYDPDPKKKCIVLFMPMIVDCAHRLDSELKTTRRGSPCAMTLFYMVFLHELGHALDRFYKSDISSETIFKPSWYSEMLAQHFTKTCIEEYGMRANDVFMTLENHQPKMYATWRNEGPYKWGNCQRLFSGPHPSLGTRQPKLTPRPTPWFPCDKTYYIEGVAFDKKEYDKDSRVLSEKKIMKPEDKQIATDLLDI
jgi:hypothetical protein